MVQHYVILQFVCDIPPNIVNILEIGSIIPIVKPSGSLTPLAHMQPHTPTEHLAHTCSLRQLIVFFPAFWLIWHTSK